MCISMEIHLSHIISNLQCQNEILIHDFFKKAKSGRETHMCPAYKSLVYFHLT